MTLFIAFLLINDLGWHWLWNLVAVILWLFHYWYYDEHLPASLLNRMLKLGWRK